MGGTNFANDPCFLGGVLILFPTCSFPAIGGIPASNGKSFLYGRGRFRQNWVYDPHLKHSPVAIIGRPGPSPFSGSSFRKASHQARAATSFAVGNVHDVGDPPNIGFPISRASFLSGSRFRQQGGIVLHLCGFCIDRIHSVLGAKIGFRRRWAYGRGAGWGGGNRRNL